MRLTTGCLALSRPPEPWLVNRGARPITLGGVSALLGRAVLLLLSSATLLAGAWAFWTQSGTYPVDHPALYACSLAPLVLAVIALVNVFVPFDRPTSAPRWAAPMVGLALGLSVGGLVMYTASFVWLGPLLVLYAVLLWTSAAAVARGGARASGPSPSEEALLDVDVEETLSIGPPGPGTRARDALVAVSAVAGVGLCWTWSPPPGGARALPLGLDVAPVLSSQAPHLRLVRIVRREGAVELSGNRIEVTLSLERPHIEVQLRKQRIVLEPALQLEEATADGFFSVPWVNGYAAEPGGPGEVVEVAEGPDIGWVRVTYPKLRVVHRGPLAPRLGAWGGPPEDAMSARLDLAVDLKKGRVRLDALTFVPRPLTVRRTALGHVRLADAGAARLHFGLGSGLDAEPPEGRPGATPTPAELLVTDDGEVVRALRARRRDEGPFETVEAGPWDDWFTVEGLRDRFLVVAPDWERQASRAPSRTAGHGLPENALVYWREQGTLSVLTDVAGTRVGPGRLSTELPAGIYRHRLALMALDRGESARARAAVERLRLAGPREPR